MRVVANCNVKVGNKLHKYGEVFDLPEAEVAVLGKAVTFVGEELNAFQTAEVPAKEEAEPEKFVSDVFPPERQEEEQPPVKPKRSRKKKTAE